MSKNTHSVAVVLAAYNGAKYIKEQIESILLELKPNDSLFIADDCSQDLTLKILEEFSDSRLKIIRNNKNIGYIANFDRLINMVDADYIFFSDQDDIWVSGRVRTMIESAMRYQKNIIFGKFLEIDSVSAVGDSINAINYNENYLLNIVRLFLGRNEFTYFGSTLMITRQAKKYLFPLISHDISHDVWIALLGNIKNDIYHLQKIVTMRRVHDANLTKSDRSYLQKLLTRLTWLRGLFFYVVK